MKNSIQVILSFFKRSTNLFEQETVHLTPVAISYTSDKPYQTIKVTPDKGKKTGT